MKSQACYLRSCKSDPKACGPRKVVRTRAAGANPPTARFWASPPPSAHQALGEGWRIGASWPDGPRRCDRAPRFPAVWRTGLASRCLAWGVPARAVCSSHVRARALQTARGGRVDRALARSAARGRGTHSSGGRARLRSDTRGSSSPDAAAVSSSPAGGVDDGAAWQRSGPSAANDARHTAQASESTRRLDHCHFCDCEACLNDSPPEHAGVWEDLGRPGCARSALLRASPPLGDVRRSRGRGPSRGGGAC